MKFRLLMKVNGGRWATLEVRDTKEEAYEQYDLYKDAIADREFKVTEDSE